MVAKEVSAMRNWYCRCTREKERGHAWKRVVMEGRGRISLRANEEIFSFRDGDEEIFSFRDGGVYESLRAKKPISRSRQWKGKDTKHS